MTSSGIMLEYRAPKKKVDERVDYIEERREEDGTLLLAYKDNERG